MDASQPVAFTVNLVIFMIVQIAMALSVGAFTVHSWSKWLRSSKTQSLWYIVIPNFVFNIVSIYCICAIAICPMTDLLGQENVTAATRRLFPCDSLCKDYIPFVQTITFIVVLFLRCIDIFKDSNAYRIHLRAKIIFCIAFVGSIGVWISLLAADWVLPNSQPWVSCIMTLCMINLWFALWMEVLIISKLIRVIRANVHETQRRTTQEIRHLITKSTLLATIAMSSTVIACFFFLIKIHDVGNYLAVHVLSEWLVSLDIYLNFLANLLTQVTYKKLYNKLCGALHIKCDVCFQTLIFGSKSNADILHVEIEIENNAKKNSEVATAAPGRRD